MRERECDQMRGKEWEGRKGDRVKTRAGASSDEGRDRQ